MKVSSTPAARSVARFSPVVGSRSVLVCHTSVDHPTSVTSSSLSIPLEQLQQHATSPPTSPDSRLPFKPDAKIVKQRFALVANLDELVRLHGIERLGFLTLTFRRSQSWTDAQRRFHSFASRAMRNLFGRDWVAVLERDERGRLHFHIVVVCHTDIRTGFDFVAFDRRVYASAPASLNALWSQLRDILPEYGFGRHQLLPIRRSIHHVSGYLSKALWEPRTLANKGVRLVRYSRGWRTYSPRFGWNSLRAREWREALKTLGATLGVLNMESMPDLLGPRWCSILAPYACMLLDNVCDVAEIVELLDEIHLFGQRLTPATTTSSATPSAAPTIATPATPAQSLVGATGFIPDGALATSDQPSAPQENHDSMAVERQNAEQAIEAKNKQNTNREQIHD